MLRTMGSSLMAKSSPGGAFRKTEEQRIENPALPGKGEIGTISRGMMEEPIERQVPPGSTKVVSSAPTIEPNVVAPSGVLPTEPLGAPGIGLPPGGIAPATPQAGVGQPSAAPNVGYMQPALRSTSTGKAGSAVSGGGVGAKVATAYQPQTSESLQLQGASSQGQPDQVMNALSGLVGSKAYADEGGKVVKGTAGQAVAGPVGKIITAVGNALRAGQIVPGGLGAKLQTYGGSSSAAQQGIGSVSKAAQNAAAALRSYNPVQTFQSNVNKTTSFLRSLFGR